MFFNHFSIKSYNFGNVMENKKYVKCPVYNKLSVNGFYTFSKQKFKKGYFFKGESHDFTEAVCVISGQVGITADKNVYLLSENKMTFHPPGEFHAIWAEGDSEPVSVIFSFSSDVFPSVTRSVYTVSDEQVMALCELCAERDRIFKTEGSAIVGIHKGMEYEAAIFRKRIELILMTVLKGQGEKEKYLESRHSDNYTLALSVMEENIENGLSVTELAEKCGMSVPTLEKTVFRYLHCGAMTYYNALKMKAAYDMLVSGKSVKETAFSLGYANQNYFSACFKKHYGYPPSKLKA